MTHRSATYHNIPWAAFLAVRGKSGAVFILGNSKVAGLTAPDLCRAGFAPVTIICRSRDGCAHGGASAAVRHLLRLIPRSRPGPARRTADTDIRPLNTYRHGMGGHYAPSVTAGATVGAGGFWLNSPARDVSANVVRWSQARHTMGAWKSAEPSPERSLPLHLGHAHRIPSKLNAAITDPLQVVAPDNLSSVWGCVCPVPDAIR